MDTNNNQQTEPLTKKKLTEIFWTNFENALKEKNMTNKDFAVAANMNEKTLNSMKKRRSCPDIWFMALSKEILKYDCTQMLFHYNPVKYTKFLTEKEYAVLELIRKGDKDEQNRKLDVITAFLRYADNKSSILGEAIPDATAPSIGTLDNTSTRRSTPRRRTTAVQTATPVSNSDAESTSASDSDASIESAPVIVAAPSPPAQTQSRSGRRKTVKDIPNQTYFDFAYDSDDGENNS